jgi:2-polyprenyl-3-methyl-5-hydroxy-6-metoxy-1,4-benzoquinol methylase
MNEPQVSQQELTRLVAEIKTSPAEALSALCAAVKKQAAREIILELLENRAPVYAALESPDPKARKNAARLLGALERESDAPALIAALNREETRFVVPSILLALGSVGGTEAQNALLSYAVPEANDETEQKHVLEIRASLEKARASLERDVPLPPRRKLDTAHDILAVSPEGFSSILNEELSALGFAGEEYSDGVLVHTDNLKKIFTARCALEFLLPAGIRLPFTPAAIASAANEILTRPYRVELRHYEGDRAAMIRQITLALGGGDNPSRYADELRIVCNGSACDVYVRPCDVPDTRFAYRKQSIPASIHPAMAACLARYALSFVTASKLFALDPFCGSGTLLFELEKTAPGAILFGLDISNFALKAARANALAAKSSARFLQKDVLKFEPREPFDLIITNMPFGNRVGTHETNEPLYRDFVRLLPRLLTPGGVAVLYTMEHRLLAACLKREPGLTVAADMRTEAGGLNPRITVVKKR